MCKLIKHVSVPLCAKKNCSKTCKNLNRVLLILNDCDISKIVIKECDSGAIFIS